jgi:membrane protein
LHKDTFSAWSEDKVPRHGAALAYYTVFSLVPLLVAIIAMIGFIFGREAAEGYILGQIGSLIGPQSAEAIKDMIRRANEPSTGLLATSAATGTLLLGASGVCSTPGLFELNLGSETKRGSRPLGSHS